MSSIWRRICVTRCSRPAGCGGSPGSVTSIRSSREPPVELRRLELGGALARAAPRAPRWTSFARLPDRAALVGGQLADRAQRRGQLGLAAEVAHAQLLELGALPAARDRASASRGSLWSGRRSGIGGHPICRLVQRDRRGHRHVQRVGPSHAGCAPLHRRRSTPAGRLAPLGRRARAPPASSSSHVAPASRSVAGRARSCARRVASSVGASGRAREDRAHADARTAFGEYGSAQPGPEHHRAVRQRVSRADDRARRCPGRRRRGGRRRRSPPGSAQRCL